VVDSRLEVVDQAVCALQPSVGDGRLSAEHQAVRGQQGCDTGCRAAVSPVEVLAVCPLAGVDRQPILAQHMAGPADPLERLRRVALGEGALERGAGFRPVAASEGGPPRVQRRHGLVALTVVPRAPNFSALRRVSSKADRA
jgi:hypothetical protein